MAALRGDYRIRREGQGDRNTALGSEGCNSGAASIWLGNFGFAHTKAGKNGDLNVREHCCGISEHSGKRRLLKRHPLKQEFLVQTAEAGTR